MSTTSVNTVIVGAGAAGLHTARLLAARTVPFEVIDAHARIGDPWRERYRSLRLFTARRYCELPGMRLPIGVFDFPTAGQFADYLEAYAQESAFPLRMGVQVKRLSRIEDAFSLVLSNGDEVLAERVVVAAGTQARPVRPPFAAELDAGIRQCHSVDYNGPEDLAPGSVLVVGAANSGTDVALEAAEAGHETTLAGRNPGEVPFRVDTPVGNVLSGLFLRHLLRTTLDTERGRRFLAEHRGHGVIRIRNHGKDLAAAGVRQVGRVAHVSSDGRPVLEDGEILDPSTVVWCTGALPELNWIDIPAAFGDNGFPDHRRGLAVEVPGLAFVGLPFQYSPLSPAVIGMGRDAEFVVDKLLSRDREVTRRSLAAPHTP